MTLAERLSGAGLDRGKRQRVDNVVYQGTAAEVVHRLGEALEHRANAHYLRAALHRLIGGVAGVEVREDEDGGTPGHGAVWPLVVRHRCDGGRVVLQRAVYGQTGFAFTHDPGRLGDLVDVAARPRGAGAEADHRHPGVDAKGPRRGRALDGDVGQVLGVGPGVDGAITVDHDLVGQAHEEHRRHQPAARPGAQDLQRRANRGRGGVDRSGDHAVDLALLEHHGADHDGVGEMIACYLLGPAFVPSQLGQRADVTLGDGPGVDHGDAAGQSQPEAAGQLGDLVRRSQQYAAGNASLRARDRGLHDARLGSFGQHHTRVGGAGELDQLEAEGGGTEPARPGGGAQRLQPDRVQRIGDIVYYPLNP